MGQSKTRKDHDHSARTLDDVLAELKKSGLKQTEPRKRILRALLENHGPYTAEELHKLITKKVCDLATVYRCLSSLETAKLIRRCEFGDGMARYEIADRGDGHHHHHLVCKECKKVEIVDDCELEEFFEQIGHKRGFSNVSHTLEFFGTCPRCK